jgi:hypothetical protein
MPRPDVRADEHRRQPGRGAPHGAEEAASCHRRRVPGRSSAVRQQGTHVRSWRFDRDLSGHSPATGWKHCLVSLKAFLGEPSAVSCQYYEAFWQKSGTYLPKLSFIRSRFNQIFQTLKSLFATIVSHVPRTVILEKNYESIASLTKMLQEFSELLKVAGNDVAVAVMTARNKKCHDLAGRARDSELIEKLEQHKTAILGVTRSLLRDLKLPVTLSNFRIKKFCLTSASFIFCTVSGSAKMQGQKMDLLLIDEAAQLKECEPLIPLQISGLKHAVLIGDECQLPATVKSKVRLVLRTHFCPLIQKRSFSFCF